MPYRRPQNFVIIIRVLFFEIWLQKQSPRETYFGHQRDVVKQEPSCISQQVVAPVVYHVVDHFAAAAHIHLRHDAALVVVAHGSGQELVVQQQTRK